MTSVRVIEPSRGRRVARTRHSPAAVLVAVLVALLAVGCIPLQTAQWTAAPQGVAVSNVDGRLEFFSAAGHAWQVSPNGDWMSAEFPATAQAPPVGGATARNSDGRLMLFRPAGTDGLAYTSQDGSASGWTPWSYIGGAQAFLGPDVALNSDGRLEAFALAHDSYPWGATARVVHAWQTTPGGGWSPLTPLTEFLPVSGPFSNLVVGRNADGRLEVFFSGVSSVRHVWQTSPGGWGGWSAWEPLPLDGTGLAVAPILDGRLEIFAASGSQLVHAWQVAPNGFWAGGQLAAPAAISGTMLVAPNADGRLEVFLDVRPGAISGAAAPAHIWQHSPNGSSGWSEITSFHVPTVPDLYTSMVTGVARNEDGRLELSIQMQINNASVGTRYETAHSWQLSPGGSWSDWELRVA